MPPTDRHAHGTNRRHDANANRHLVEKAKILRHGLGRFRPGDNLLQVGQHLAAKFGQ
jgi:hypothetical protein